MIKTKQDAIRISAGLVFMAGGFKICLWDRPDKNCVIYADEVNSKLCWILEDTVNGTREVKQVDEYDGMADMIWENREYINQSGQLDKGSKKKMDTVERIKMVKAMEYIARQVNDEDVFEIWLVSGVADGDIEYGDLTVKAGDEDEFGTYIEDENFGDLMHTFLRTMKAAYKSGGLYCDDVVSKKADV